MASRNFAALTACALGAVSCALAQTPPVKARDLYFQADTPAAPAATVAAAPATPAVPAVPAVHRLGLRYNLLLVNPATRESHAVDPDANFSPGDCFALEFAPNRDGHLYIFNRGSSGELQALLPSAEMPDEVSLVKSDRTLRVPQEYCFRLSDPAGVETLIVAVTERSEDLTEFHAALQKSGGDGDTISMKQVSHDVETWRQQQLTGRNIAIEKLDAPPSGNERPHAVYAVLTTSGGASRMVIEVKIRHE